MKKEEFEAFEVIDSKLDALSRRFKEFESFEERIDRTVEAKVFEIKALCYIILIVVCVLLAFVIGAAAKLFLG